LNQGFALPLVEDQHSFDVTLDPELNSGWRFFWRAMALS